MNRRQLLRGATAAAAGAALIGTAARTEGVAEAAPSGRYRIDLHAHFLPPEYRASLISHGHLTIGGYPTPEWSPEAAINFMDNWGIEAQALSISDPGVGFLPPAEAREMARYCNDYAANLIKRQGRRFGAFAVLPMPDIAASIAELEYALDRLHLDGVVLLTAYNGVYLGDPRFEPLMAALEARKAYVFVHPGAIPADAKPNLPLPDFLYEFTFDTTRAAMWMITTGVMNRYPNIRFQLSHAGGTVPFLSRRLDSLAQTTPAQLLPDNAVQASLFDTKNLISKFYYDTALSASKAAMSAVTDRSHVVFGSDWPFSSLTFNGSGDPAPGLSTVFNAQQRREVERLNPLRQLPRLASRLS